MSEGTAVSTSFGDTVVEFVGAEVGSRIVFAGGNFVGREVAFSVEFVAFWCCSLIMNAAVP